MILCVLSHCISLVGKTFPAFFCGALSVIASLSLPLSQPQISTEAFAHVNVLYAFLHVRLSQLFSYSLVLRHVFML